MSLPEFERLAYGIDPSNTTKEEHRANVEGGADSTLDEIEQRIGKETIVEFIDKQVTDLYKVVVIEKLKAAFDPDAESEDEDKLQRLTDPRVIALGMFMLGYGVAKRLAEIEALNNQFEI